MEFLSNVQNKGYIKGMKDKVDYIKLKQNNLYAKTYYIQIKRYQTERKYLQHIKQTRN